MQTKPLDDLLQAGFELYLQSHPWLADHQLSPKSVARDMHERAMTFAEYVQSYNLARSEGLLLRYLTDAYKALRQTVPDDRKTEELDDLESWLGEVVRQTDSSLLDEWQALADPESAPLQPDLVDEGPPPVTANTRAFTVLVRNAMFRRVQLAAARDWAALGEMDGLDGWNADRWAETLEPYFDEHETIGTGPDARGPHLLAIDKQPGKWLVRQIFDDPEGDHDWSITAEVDLAASDAEGAAVIRVTGAGLTGFAAA